MPPPRRTSLAAANKIFVDRTEPQIAFERAALHIPADRSSLLVYYGVGGQGKTALCRELLRKTDPAQEPSYGFLRRALLDLHGRPKTDPDLLLVWLRNAFAKAGVPTPCFDLAFAIVWDATRGEQELPAMESAWLARQKDVAGQVASEGFAKIGEAISEAAISVPVFGKLFSFAAKWSIRKGYEKYLHATREALAEMYDGAELKPAFELSQLLPWMLAQDLNHHLAAHPDARFVLLVDEYERVFDQGGAGTLWRDNPFDRHVRSFVQETNGLLAVFFSRERLPWDDDPAWKDDLADTQHLLGGLSDGDADDFLKAIPVPDAALRAAMIAGARETAQPGSPVYPLMLDLQVEHWRELVAQNRQISPEMFNVAASDFVARRNDIIKRVLRDYEQPMQSTLIRLACARRFDRTTFEYAVREFYTGLSLDAFERLADLSFINRAPDGYLSFHGIVRDVLIEMLPVDERLRVMRSLFEHFEARSKAASLREIGAAHAVALFETAYLGWQLSKTDYLSWLQKACEPLLEAAKFVECLELWRQTSSLIRAKYGDVNENTAFCIAQIANVHASIGNFRETLRSCEEALSIFERTGTLESAPAVEALTNLGIALQILGDNTRARQVIERSIKENIRVHGRMHQDTAAAINSLGLHFRSEGDLEKAADALRESIDIYEKLYGKSHHHYGVGLSNLALTLDERGKRDEARSLLEQALLVCEESLGNEHPTIATIAGNLAHILSGAGEREAAIKLYKRAIAIAEKALGHDHANIALFTSNLLLTQGGDGDFDEVRDLYLKAIATSAKALGENHSNTLAIKSNLAFHYESGGRFEESLSAHQETLAAAQKHLPPDHPDIALYTNSLASTLLKSGDARAALELFRRAVELADKQFPAGHGMTMLIQSNLAICLAANGDTEESEALLSRILATIEQGGSYSEGVHTNVAHMLAERERYAEEIVYRKRLVEIAETIYGPQTLEGGLALNNLAIALWKNGHTEESVGLFQSALATLEVTVGNEHKEAINVIVNLAAALSEHGEQEQAKQLHFRALKATENTYGPKHIMAAYRLNDIALILQGQERFEEASSFYERALAIAEEVQGRSHPDVQIILQNMTENNAALDGDEAEERDIASKPSIH